MISKKQHILLKKSCQGWAEYMAGYMAGKMGVDSYGVDCSCGCKYFIELQDSGDWGVCSNPDSIRSGLLTWEHMGCPNGFKKGKN